MALDQVANFIRGNADGSVSNSATSISVVDASVFPDPSSGEYNVVVWDVDNFPRPDQDPDVEVVRVTGRDTTADTLTVTRAQEGTSAASHPDGSAIHLSPTAKMFSDIDTRTSGLSDDGNTLTIGSLVIGGTLYEEDGNSPLQASGSSSHTYTVSGSYDDIIVIPQRDSVGFDQMRVGGDTGSNYDVIDNGDSETTGQTEWNGLPRLGQISYFELIADRDTQTFLKVYGITGTGETIAGSNQNVTGNIGQFTLIDSGGSNRSLNARVYGRSLSV